MSKKLYGSVIVTLALGLGLGQSGAVQAFELKYLHPAGTTLDYQLDVQRDNQLTSVDVRRAVDSNVAGVLTITTSFENGAIGRGGLMSPVPEMDGANLQTVMNERGVVTALTALGDFGDTLDALSLSMNRDLWNSLAISSFPASDLAVGDSWTKTASDGSLFTYVVEEAGLSLLSYASVARISISATIPVDNRQEVVEARKTFYTRGNIDLAGDLYFDVDAGRIVRHELMLDTHVLTVLVGFDGVPQVSLDQGLTNVFLEIQ